MITDEQYNLDLDFYLARFPTDEAIRLARQCAEGRKSRARKADTAWMCAAIGVALIVVVLAVAVLTITA